MSEKDWEIVQEPLQGDIRTVRRVSDNEVFSISQKIQYCLDGKRDQWFDGFIEGFYPGCLDSNQLMVEINDPKMRFRVHKFLYNVRHPIPEQKKQEAVPVSVSDTVIDFFKKNKEEAVKRGDVGRAAEWRQLERLCIGGVAEMVKNLFQQEIKEAEGRGYDKGRRITEILDEPQIMLAEERGFNAGRELSDLYKALFKYPDYQHYALNKQDKQ